MTTPKVELAAAYISLVPSMRGSKKEIERELAGAVSPKTGASMGSSIAAGIKKSVKVAAAGGGLLAGIGIKKGLDRLLGLETARAQLKGLGFDAKSVEKIYGSALKSVDGTAFGVAEAMRAASGAIGAGIKPGKELTRYLTLTGDAAGQANIDFNAMAQMLNKVQGAGKLSGEVIQQMGENGLQVMPMLVKALGKPQAEIQKMVSKGEVSAEQFRAILEDNIGGSAVAMGDTTVGAWRNMWASVGRIAANFMQGVFPKLKSAMQDVTKFFKGAEKPAAAWGATLGDIANKYGPPLVDVLMKVGGWLRENVPTVGTFVGILVAAGAAVKIWAAVQWLLNTALLANPIGLVVLALAGLAAGLVYAYKSSETFRNIVQGAWTGIQVAASVAWSVIQPVLKAYWFYLSKVLFPVIKFLWSNVVKPVFAAVGSKIVSVWQDQIKPAFDKMREGVAKVKAAFKTAKEGIATVWGGVKSAITGPIDAAKRALNAFFKGIDKIARFFGKSFNFRFDVGSNVKTTNDHSSGAQRNFTGGIGPKHLAASRSAIGGKGNSGGGRVWPANTKTLSANYAGHSGVDIAASMGSPIKAAASGKIDYVGWGRGYGQAIFQRFGDGLSAVYGHTSKTMVRAGQSVRAGQRIGLVGSTGRSTGPHLHFEVNKAGPFGSAANRAATLSWLGGSSFSKSGGGISLPKVPGLRLGGWLGPLGGALLGMAKSWASGGLFDTGGILPHGGMAMNLSGRPERVLSPRQTQAFERASRDGFSSGGGTTRADLDYFADRIIAGVLSGSRNISVRTVDTREYDTKVKSAYVGAYPGADA